MGLGKVAQTKVSKNPITSPPPTFSPRKSSKISKPPSNSSAKSQWILDRQRSEPERTRILVIVWHTWNDSSKRQEDKAI